MTPNITKMEELLSQVATKEEVDALLKPLKELAAKRKYGLVWEEPESGAYDSEAAENELLSHFPFLKELTDRALIKDTEKPSNLLIEGDNLHALQAMQYTHKGKVDVIYIDPPYNTGNQDFVYNDRFVDKEDSWRHSSWLSFMNKRLRLARELMSDEGVIFISIDDNEMAQLKLLCDQVFGEANFVGNIIQDKGNAQNDADSLQKNHEYILTYKKSAAILINASEELIKVNEDDLGFWYRGSGLTIGGDGGTLNARPNLGYTIYYNQESGDKIAVKDYDVIKARHSNEEDDVYSENIELLSQGYKKIRPPKKGNMLGRWTWSIEKFNENKELIGINKSKNGHSVFQKKYVSESEKEGKILYSRVKKTSPSKSILKFPTANGTKSLVDVLGEKLFNNPKNIDMVKYLINLHPNPNALVLDFFAGSGTTGHAVMELNKEDGGNRQFILCTNNEISSDKETDFFVEQGHIVAPPKTKRGNAYKEWKVTLDAFKSSENGLAVMETPAYQNMGIARAVTYERLKRVIEGYTTPKGKQVEGIPNNLHHFLVSLKEDTQDDDLNSYKLIKETVDLIRLKENVYTQVKAQTVDGVPVVTLEDAEKIILIVLDTDVYDDQIRQICELYPGDKRERVLYATYVHYPYVNLRFEELPKEILRTLKARKESR